MSKVHVNEGYELYQIITDFGDPLEIFREGIQNSFDETATEIYIKVYEQRKISGDELIIEICDNGNGLKRNRVDSFLMLQIQAKLLTILFQQESMDIRDMVQKSFLMQNLCIFVLKLKMGIIGR